VYTTRTDRFTERRDFSRVKVDDSEHNIHKPHLNFTHRFAFASKNTTEASLSLFNNVFSKKKKKGRRRRRRRSANTFCIWHVTEVLKKNKRSENKVSSLEGSKSYSANRSWRRLVWGGALK
jgi:hypothetical protein